MKYSSWLRTTIFLLIGLCYFFLPQSLHGREADSTQAQRLERMQLRIQELIVVKQSYDSALLLAEDLIQISQKLKAPTSEVIAHILASHAADRQGAIDQHFFHTQSAYTIAQAKLAVNNAYRTVAFTAYTQTLEKRGDYQQAIDNYHQILANSDSLDQQGISKIYGNLGISYIRIGDYQQALRMYQQELQLLQSFGTEEQQESQQVQVEIAETLFRIGKCYVYLEKEQKAISYLGDSRTRYLSLGEERYYKSLIQIYQSLASLFLKKEKADSMYIYLQANSRLQETYDRYYPEQLSLSSAKWHGLRNEWDQAIPFFQEAIVLGDKRSSRLKAQLYKDLARGYLELEDYSEALRASQQGLSLICQDLDTAVRSLPSIDQIVYLLEVVPILRLKGECWLKLAQSSPTESTSAYQESLLTIERATELITQIRRSFLAEGSKLSLASQVVPMYEDGIEAALALYESSADPTYLDRAYSFAENGKAIVLFESLQQASALQQNIPESISQEERRLKRDIAYYRSQIFEVEQGKKTAFQGSLNSWKQQLFELEESYQQLLKRLEQEFPTYHATKYQQSLVSLTELQSAIQDPETLVLEYFQGERQIYLFAITQDGTQTYSIPWESALEEQMRQLQLLLSNQQEILNKGLKPTYLKHYAALTHQMYQTFLRPALENRQQIVDHLVLIPDGYLYQLPFEIFLTHIPEEEIYGYQHLPYLLNQYVCTYEYSGTLLSSSQDKQLQAEELWGGFAPSYGVNGIPDALPTKWNTPRDQITPLFFTAQEVEDIQAIIGGDTFIGESATKEHFQEIASKYRILHLAMHAIGNDINPDFSSLIFTTQNDSHREGFLYASNIQQMNLNAELTILSACNTGTGEWIKGEGVMSLGRAFRFAGSQSVLMSLWRADDRATATIMKSFYQGLHDGQSKGKALQLAKQSYIQNHLNTHPYFWSGFVLVGVDAPVDQSSFPVWLIPALLILAIVLFFLYQGKHVNLTKQAILLLVLSPPFLGDLQGQTTDTTAIDSVQIKLLDRIRDNAIMQYAYRQELDSAMATAQILLDKSSELPSYEHQVVAYIIMSNIFNIQGDYENSMRSAESASEAAKAHLPWNSPATLTAFNSLTNVLLTYGDFQQAIKNYQFILTHADFLEGQGLAKMYANLGNAYVRKGEYLQALSMFKQGSQIQQDYIQADPENHTPDMDVEIAANLYRTGRCYVYLKDREPAMEYLHRSRVIYQQMGEKRFYKQLMQIYQSASSIFFETDEADSLLHYIENMRKIQDQQRPYFPEFASIYQGKWHRLRKEWADASIHFQKAIELEQQYQRPLRIQAKAYLDLAEIHVELGELDEALKNCQTGLQLTARGLAADSESVPAVNNIIYPLEAVRLLALKGKIWAKVAETAPDGFQHAMKQALSSYQLAAEVVANIRKSFLVEGAKLALAAEVMPMYEHGIQLSLELYDRLGDESFLHQAFNFAEMGKAAVLFETLQQASARQSIVPDSILMQERSLKREISYYRIKIFETEQQAQAKDSARLRNWQQQLFGMEETYRTFQQQLESSYPSYHQAKYQNGLQSLSDIQGRLPDQNMILEYFQGDSSLYLFVVDKNRIRSFVIAWDQVVQADVARIQQMFKDKEEILAHGFEQEYIQEYGRLAYRLYQTLVDPAISDSATLPEHLVFIPDGQLYHIPFEALLTELPQEKSWGYQSLPYLISQYVCTYEYSASLMINPEEIETDSKELFAGFAPSYGQDGIPSSLPQAFTEVRDEIAPLIFAPKEVQAIQRILGKGEVYIGPSCTREFFTQQAPSYRILHLAMHALSNDVNSDFSSLVFAAHPDEPDGSFLYASDIQQLELQADLVVLSACNTASGEWVRGEGILSLGRAFRRAGSPNVLMSLWQVEDKATSEIMESFYRRLQEQESMGQSLRSAKIQYYQNSYTAHPYFWSGFVLAGPDRVLFHSHWLMILLVGAGILALLFLGWKVIHSRKDAGTNTSHFQ